MDGFLLQVFSGLASGSIYALVALALVMIYQSTHHINLAQGEMAMFSTFIAWALIQAGVSYWIAFFLTVGIAFVGGVLVQRIFIKPVERAPVLNNVIVFVGLLVIFNAMAGWIFDHVVKAFDSPFPTQSPILNEYLSGHQLGTVVVTLCVVAVVYAFFRFTPIGLAMRAAAQNPDSAALVGIRVSWMLALGWGMASAIGSVAGMMAAPVLFLDPNLMAGVLLYGFAAALLGGIDNAFGAIVGGLLVGVIENILGAYVIGNDLKLTVALVMIVGTLTLMPNGLFGKNVVTRV
jgi:branched-chain amino acid transport system permease protein